MYWFSCVPRRWFFVAFFFQLDRKKKEGTYKTKKQKEQEAKAEAAKAAMLAAGLEGGRYTCSTCKSFLLLFLTSTA